MFDREAIVAGISGRVKTRWFNRLGIFRKIEVPFDSSMPDQVKVILEKKPDIFVGYPSRLGLIAKYLADNHIKVKTPKAIFAESETLLPEVRQARRLQGGRWFRRQVTLATLLLSPESSSCPRDK